MAPKKSLQQYALDAKEAKRKGKKTVSKRSSEPQMEEETPEKHVEEEQHMEEEEANPQTPTAKKTASKPSAKRTLSSATSSKKKLKMVDHTGPPSPSAPSAKSKVPDIEPQLPISWFNSLEAHGKWVDWFHTKPLGYCDMVDPHLFDELSLSCLQKFKASSCYKMINPGMVSYPRLTRLFYLNLRGVPQDDGIVLESMVAGVKITITNQFLKRLLGLDPICLTEPYPSKTDCITRAKSEYLLPNCGNVRQLTQTSLKLEPKILFLLLVRCIVPKESSKELLTDKLLEIMFLIMSGYKLDIPALIADHMIRAVSSTRNTSLPYSNFLPLIFKEFNVPVDNEETLTSGPSTINEKTLQKLEIVKTANGNWKFIRDLTHEEKDSIPNLRLKGSHIASSSSPYNKELEDKIKAMELDAIETREKVIELVHRNNYLTEQVTYLIEKIKFFEEILIKFHDDKLAGKTTDVPESSRKHDSSDSADVPKCSKKKDDSTDSEDPEEVEASAWEHAARLKDDDNTDVSMLDSLAQVAAKLKEEEQNNVAADVEQQMIEEQVTDEKEAAIEEQSIEKQVVEEQSIEKQVVEEQVTEEKETAQTEQVDAKETDDADDDPEAPVAPDVPTATEVQPASADAQVTAADFSPVPPQTNN